MSKCICPNVAQLYLPNCPEHGHISKIEDVHTMPTQGNHQSSSNCWCMPRVIFIAENGSQQWLHNLVE